MDEYKIGLVLGMAAGIFVFGVLIALLMRKNGLNGFSEKNYDERQQRARGIAFKSGFFTLLIYSFLYGISGMLLDKPWCDTFTGNFIGICLGVAVFAVVSIMKDAYMSLKDNPKRIIILFAVITAVNVIAVVARALSEESMLYDGALTFACTNVIVVILFAVIFIAMGIRAHMDKKELGE